METLTNVLVQAANQEATGTMPIYRRLAALGACPPALAWVREQNKQTAQALWTNADCYPNYMLWLLRRTCRSYKSEKIRKFAALMAELVSAVCVAKMPLYKDEAQAVATLQRFAKGELETEDLRALCKETPNFNAGRIYNTLAILSKGLGSDWRRPYIKKEAHIKADNLALFIPDRQLAEARLTILKHFPKAPRLP